MAPKRIRLPESFLVQLSVFLHFHLRVSCSTSNSMAVERSRPSLLSSGRLSDIKGNRDLNKLQDFFTRFSYSDFSELFHPNIHFKIHSLLSNNVSKFVPLVHFSILKLIHISQTKCSRLDLCCISNCFGKTNLPSQHFFLNHSNYNFYLENE